MRIGYNPFFNRKLEEMNKRHTWVAVAIVGAAAISGGVAMYEGGQNREAAEKAQNQYNDQPDYIQLPDYAESTQARQDWSKTLTDWGQPGAGYGANLPDYEAIFENAKRRINEHYMGSATSPGVID